MGVFAKSIRGDRPRRSGKYYSLLLGLFDWRTWLPIPEARAAGRQSNACAVSKPMEEDHREHDRLRYGSDRPAPGGNDSQSGNMTMVDGLSGSSFTRRNDIIEELPERPGRAALAWRDLADGARKSWMWTALALQDIKLRYRGSVL